MLLKSGTTLLHLYFKLKILHRQSTTYLARDYHESTILHPGANAPGVNSKIKKNRKKIQKILNFFCDILSQVFLVHENFHHEITFVEVMPRKTKSELQNAFVSNIFRASILFFYHTFHQCDFAIKIYVHSKHLYKYAKKKSEFFDIFLNFFYFTVHTRSICSWV